MPDNIADRIAERVNLRRRFLDYTIFISPTGCMEYRGATNGHGYARARFLGKQVAVHRYIAFGSIKNADESPLVVMHICDNRICINPDHLKIGTHYDNSKDAAIKGRNLPPILKGEKNNGAVLTRVQVDEIREKYTVIKNQSALAREYNVTQTTIWRIVNNTHWKDETLS